MSKAKVKWKYGENRTQKYYDTKIGTDYLCVFCNKWQPDIWMGMINNSMIWDKTWNDRQRKSRDFQKNATYLCLQRPVCFVILIKNTSRRK